MGLSRVFFDSNLWIYMIEDTGERSARVRSIVERMSVRRDELLTSTLTLSEVLAKPVAMGETALAERYESVLSGPGISVLAFDRAAARIFAELRKDKSLKPPDAIQLSCAATARCDLFITNDERLSRKVVPGIQFIASLERAFL
ncbi:MAG: PIN domain-containing protein [Bryobacteraceae bacterium]